MDIRELIQEILTEEGYKVTVASSAREAKEARSNRDFDLILLDIWMPDTDGISLLKEWSESNQLNSSVVMMSGHGTVDTAIESTHLGASSFIEKPLSIAKLLRTVEEALAEKKSKLGSSRVSEFSSFINIGRSNSLKSLRSELRKVRRSLTNEYESLEMRLWFFNIALVPLVLTAFLIILAIARSIRRKRHAYKF